MKRRSVFLKSAFLAFSIAGIVLFVLGGCLAATGQTGTGNTIDMNDNNFSPATLTVTVNTTVTWQNVGMHTHTVTSDTGAPLSSGDITSGGSFSFPFITAGTYPYYCIYHGSPGNGMAGTITVTN